MMTMIIKKDSNGWWDLFLKMYNIRHDHVLNDETKFILYYEHEQHLMHIAFNFGVFYQQKLSNHAANVQWSKRGLWSD